MIILVNWRVNMATDEPPIDVEYISKCLEVFEKKMWDRVKEMNDRMEIMYGDREMKFIGLKEFLDGQH